jgi:hypothetical protein
MITVDVSTQAEFDAETKKGNHVRVRVGFYVARENSSVAARENSSVEAWGNSSVEAWGNSSVAARENSSVVAWENSSVVARENSSVEAWENSSVVAWENSSVVARGNSSVEAWGNVFVRLFSALKVRASAHVVIMKHGKAKSVRGGVRVDAMKIKSAADWCELYGAKVVRGVVTLFKALDEDFTSLHGARYAPGDKPEATDWDGGEAECGGGLHFSPSPGAAKRFHYTAKKFAACPVKLTDIVVHPNGRYPEKVKAPRVCKPCYEVDEHGNKV